MTPKKSEVSKAFRTSANLHHEILNFDLKHYNFHALGRVVWNYTHWRNRITHKTYAKQGNRISRRIFRPIPPPIDMLSISKYAGHLLKGWSEEWVIEELKKLIPPIPTGRIFSDFLGQGWMTLLAPAYSKALREEKLRAYKARGFTDIDIYLYNENDNPWGENFWKILDVDEVLDTLSFCIDTGLRVTLWCFPDENDLTLEQAKNILRNDIPRVKDYVTRYVPILEGDETFSSDELKESIDLIHELDPDKPVYLHWSGGNNGGISWDVDGIYYQFEGETVDEVQVEAAEKSIRWRDANKKFIAGEFTFPLTHEEARELGEAVDDIVDGRANG